MPERKFIAYAENDEILGVIHLFALLHALVVLVCQWVGVDDALTLTIFTMTMTVILCLKKACPLTSLL